jgi:TRAP-type mannitol/chloroaromatic compound transport system permease small subunit
MGIRQKGTTALVLILFVVFLVPFVHVVIVFFFFPHGSTSRGPF